MVRAVALIALLALAACKAPASKPSEPAAVSSAAAAPAQPAHHWAYKNGAEYGYISASHAAADASAPTPEPTTIRYLGQQDGLYAIAEVAGGAVVVATCANPCQQVRLRGAGLDQTLPLSPDSIVAAALADAFAGQLEIYKPQAAPPTQ